MSEEDFKLFDIIKNRVEGPAADTEKECPHETIDADGVCDSCFVILHQKTEAEFNSHSRASAGYVSKHNRVNHFIKILDRSDLTGVDFHQVLSDFQKFVLAFDDIPRGKRKNFLLDRWVLWKISERRGVPCERYKIKGAKSEEEHERLLALVFEKLGWS